MAKATKQAETEAKAKAKVNTEDFKGLKLTIIQSPAKQGDDNPDVPAGLDQSAGGVYPHQRATSTP